jgi:hypothetical protein
MEEEMPREKCPPLTADDIRSYLEDLTFSVYLYVGDEQDDAWDNAQVVYGLLPRLRIYLVEDAEIIQQWIQGQSTKGVVFGWDQNPVQFLNQGECDNLKTVLNAVQDAR